MEVKAKAIWLSAMGAAFLAALISLIVVSANTEPFPLDAFLSSLQRSGYEVKTDMTSSELLRGRVVQITLTGEDEHTLLLYQSKACAGLHSRERAATKTVTPHRH